MLFQPTLKSVCARKSKALGVFEKTRTELSAAVDQFKNVIGIAQTKIADHQTKIESCQGDVDAARKEILAAEETISKINSIVGA
jgi:peptidoglycan hydrolase CwlO-like protein